jgi:polyhydroxybutyrate depolymerase
MGIALRVKSLVLIVSLFGCTRHPDVVEQSRRLPDSARGYRLHVRSDHDAKQPATVLLALHAFKTDPRVLPERWALVEHAVEKRGWLLVVPEGNRNSRGDPYWNASKACCDVEQKNPDDIGYLDDVLADIRRRYEVDATRVFALGVSNGGFMAHAWACRPESGLTAIASISGAAPGPSDPPCAPGRPVSVLAVHGDRDEVVAFDGGTFHDHPHPSVRKGLEAWLEPAGCARNAEPIKAAHPALFQITTDDETWRCPKARLAQWTVPGGEHRLKLGVAFTARVLDFLEGT